MKRATFKGRLRTTNLLKHQVSIYIYSWITNQKEREEDLRKEALVRIHASSSHQKCISPKCVRGRKAHRIVMWFYSTFGWEMSVGSSLGGVEGGGHFNTATQCRVCCSVLWI